jgi:phosphoglycolate phosphatase-like HAD superfamily hydrolase
MERLRPAVATRAKVGLFDFDGTVSLIRSGWMDVMIPMMVEVLQETGTSETREELDGIVRDFVARLTGKQTIYQMIQLAEEVTLRGGSPRNPLEYKYQYLDLLNERIKDRLTALRRKSVPADTYLVPGTRALLEDLRGRGLRLYLASGTDEPLVLEEAKLLEIDSYFDGGMYGAQDDYKSFSKAILIQRIIRDAGVAGDEFLGFGDGYVEIENVKQVGGVAVGVATDEPSCERVDEWKRQRLIGVGADYIIPHFLGREELLGALFPKD